MYVFVVLRTILYLHIILCTCNNSNLLFLGVILVGPSGSGKSACIQALIDALCANPRGLSRQSNSNTKAAQQAEVNHRLLKINPCVVDDYKTMFGHLNQQNDWVDGIFTHSWRKANRVSYYSPQTLRLPDRALAAHFMFLKLPLISSA